MKSRLLIVALFLTAWMRPVAQPGFEILKDVKKIDIPFEFRNNLILIDVTFNRVFPLKFIFDTGAENTILAKRNFTDLLGIPYEREFKVLGSDMRTELTAYLVRNIHLRMGGMLVPNHSLLVLKEDYFNLEEMLGIQIHGIIGADVFRGLVVKINYDRKIITLSKSNSTKLPGADYQELPILIERNKPYLQTSIRTQNDTLVKVKLLLDTGAMLSLLLNTDTNPGLKAPSNTISGNIGIGLGGFLNGHLGRVASLDFGNMQCSDVVTNFQEINEGMDTSMLQGRNGIIGNEVLSRFHVIIDYPTQKLYLKPSKRYKQTFEFDRSGLVIIAADLQLNQFLVQSVLPGTPAALAGLLEGDEIKRINCTPKGMLTLERIYQIFKKKEGTKITIVVKRESKRQKFVFFLKNLI